MVSQDGKKTILVVDDEPEVRKLVGAMVSRYGFNVLTADTGDHAITVFKKKIDEIDLLLTDVVAPGMSGPVLADKLAEIKPGLKVLFMSGYDNTKLVQHYVVEKGLRAAVQALHARRVGAQGGAGARRAAADAANARP